MSTFRRGLANPGTGTLVTEEVTLIYSYVDADRLEASLPDLRKLLHDMGRDLNQGEVVIEVNDRFYKIREFDAE